MAASVTIKKRCTKGKRKALRRALPISAWNYICNTRCITIVQLTLADSDYANDLQKVLLQDGRFEVVITNDPYPDLDSVVVIDAGRWAKLSPIDPNRVIAVAESGDSYWQPGVHNLIFKRDSIALAVLAIAAVAIRSRGSTVRDA